MKKHIAIMTMLLLGAVGAHASELWITDFEQAKAKAKSANKLMLVNFTGSDWCPPCMMLDREVFATREFKTFAAEHFVLLKADFPRRTPQSDALKKQNQQLAEAYSISGFPTILLLDHEGEERGRTGYRPGGVKAYIDHLRQLKAGE